MTNPYGQQQPYGQQPPGQPQPGYGPPSGATPAPYGQPSPPYGQPAPYGQPSPFGGGPGMGGPGMGGPVQDIPDYKGWAIASLFLGGVLLGIFAIMKSNEVGQYKMQGNYAMAEQASRTTKTICLISTILGGLGCVLGLIIFIVSLAAI
ncbi:CD225/dispanin family protein [Amycolatopsis lurida]